MKYLAAFLLSTCSFALSGETILWETFQTPQYQWQTSSGKEQVAVTPDGFDDHAALEINDNSYTLQTQSATQRIPTAPGWYQVSGKIKINKGFGPLILLDFFDQNGEKLGNPCLGFSSAPAKTGEWIDFSFNAPAPWDDTRFLSLRIVSLSHVINHVQLDNLKIERLPITEIAPNWKPQYKLRPDSPSLTPADVAGPDGIVYPDFSRAGVQGGIPDLSKRRHVKADDYGAVADDDRDDGEAVGKAIASLPPDGGVVELGEGVYHLRQLLLIQNSNVVLSGQGKERTLIIFDYRLPADGIEFYGLRADSGIGPKTNLIVFAEPQDLKGITLKLGDVILRKWSRTMHSGNTFWLSANAAKAKDLPPGPQILTAVADYGNNRLVTKTIAVRFDPDNDDAGTELPAAAIEFRGPGLTGKPGWAKTDFLRGSKEIELKSDFDIRPGEWILLRAQETKRRRQETLNTCTWGEFRTYLVGVKEINRRKLTLDQPLRLEFPQADQTSVQKMELISGCGIQNLTFEAKSSLWLTAIMFKNAVNCWASQVRVDKCGRFPVYTDFGKFCTITDSEFYDAHYKLEGGTAYVGFDKSYDCLMDRVQTKGMRHAPLFQWSAAGNVIRRSKFQNSDMHYHAGWSNENLIEQCEIDAVNYPTRNSGYGEGIWVSPPEDGSHGPNGPRNVIYNNLVKSEKGGVSLGGMNENWIIVYNRFLAADGCGVSVKTMCFDTIIAGNVFALKNNRQPMVMISSPDCTGIEIYNNILYGGNGKFFGGLLAPAIERQNQHHAYQDEPPPPEVKTPSLYEYQKQLLQR